jgi:hypothetical protein
MLPAPSLPLVPASGSACAPAGTTRRSCGAAKTRGSARFRRFGAEIVHPTQIACGVRRAELAVARSTVWRLSRPLASGELRLQSPPMFKRPDAPNNGGDDFRVRRGGLRPTSKQDAGLWSQRRITSELPVRDSSPALCRWPLDWLLPAPFTGISPPPAPCRWSARLEGGTLTRRRIRQTTGVEPVECSASGMLDAVAAQSVNPRHGAGGGITHAEIISRQLPTAV